MSNPWLVVIGIVAVGVLYVLLPVVGDAFLRFRGTRRLRCPETGADAEVGPDARYASLTAAFREPLLRVRTCSLWPKRKGCRQGCLRPPEIAAARSSQGFGTDAPSRR